MSVPRLMAMSRLPTARRASPHTSVKGRGRRGACLGAGVRELELQTAPLAGGRGPVRSGSGAESGANGCSAETASSVGGAVVGAASSVGSAVVGAASSVGSAVVGVSSSVIVVSSLVGSAAGLRRGRACGVQLLVGVLVGAAVGPGAVVRTSPPYPVPSGPATPSPRAMARLTQDS